MSECQKLDCCEPSVYGTMEFPAAGGQTDWLNVTQAYTATCPDGYTGDPVTVTIPAGTVDSTVSQDDADAQALAMAQQQAESQLICTPDTPIPTTYYNTEQSYTATCPDGTTGDPVTVTKPPGAYTSMISQADADQQALLAASEEAEAALSCSGSPPTPADSCDDFPESLTVDPAFVAWADAMRNAYSGPNTPINSTLEKVAATFPACFWRRNWGEPWPITRYGTMGVLQATPTYGYPTGTKFMFQAGTGSSPFSVTYFSNNAGFDPVGTYTWDPGFGYVFPLAPGNPPSTITIT